MHDSTCDGLIVVVAIDVMNRPRNRFDGLHDNLRGCRYGILIIDLVDVGNVVDTWRGYVAISIQRQVRRVDLVGSGATSRAVGQFLLLGNGH